MSINLSDQQLKVLILYSLKSAVGPLPQSSLADVFGTCDINYFNIAPVLEELIESGFVSRYETSSKDSFLKVSDEGIEIAENLKSIISIALRQKIVYLISIEIQKLKQALSVDYSISERTVKGIKEYVANMRLLDGGEELINLSMYCPTELQAQMMTETFKKDSHEIYKKILDVFFKR